MKGAAHEAAKRLREVGLGELLDRCRRRMEALDGAGGTVTLSLGREAREALAGLLGLRRLPSQVEVRVQLAELDAALRRSRYGVSLAQVLEADGGAVVSDRERAEAAKAQWQRHLEELATAVAPARQWIATLGGEGPVSRLYRRAYRADPHRATAAALAVARAVAHLPADGELLAVFAARVTSDPHAFDPQTLAGRLLLLTLQETGHPLPKDLRPGEARALLLQQAGLDVDGVSSTVLVANPGSGSHAVLTAMAEAGGGWPVPLAELARLSRLPARDGVAHVVENPAVFEWLVRKVAAWEVGRRPTLIATGGFLSAAALLALDLMAVDGTRLRYGGDFDRAGLAIAGQLLERYPGMELWRMSPADYASAVREGTPRFGDGDRQWLATVEGPLAPTARAMAERGIPAYQENLLEQLLGDLAELQDAGSGCPP